METDTKTFTIVFKKDRKTTYLGLRESLAYCEEYIHKNNGSDNMFYFKRFRGGIVRIMCNETGEDYLITPVL